MPPVRPEVVAAFRHRFGLSPSALAALLGLAPSDVAEYEEHGGPAWLGRALAGLALGTLGASEDEVRRFIGHLGLDGG